MKPRRAQEDHAHPEIVLGGGGLAGLHRCIYPAPGGGLSVYGGTLAVTRTSAVALGDCSIDLTGQDPETRYRSDVTVARPKAGWEVTTSPWLNRAAGFQARVVFGLDEVKVWNTRSTLMAGVFESAPTEIVELDASSPQGVGVCIDYDDTDVSDSGAGPQPFKWVSNDGSTCEKSAVGMRFTGGHSYSLVITAAAGAGALSAKLTDLTSGASASHTFSTTPESDALLVPVLLAGWWDGPGRTFVPPVYGLSMTSTLETSAGVYVELGEAGDVSLTLDVYPYLYDHNATSVTYTTTPTFNSLSPYTRPIPPGLYPSYTYPYPTGAVVTHRDTLGTFPNAGGAIGGNSAPASGPPYFGGTGTPVDDIVVTDTFNTPDVEVIRAYSWVAPKLFLMGFDTWELVDDGWPG